jgi:hypothetical protein
MDVIVSIAKSLAGEFSVAKMSHARIGAFINESKQTAAAKACD